MKTKQILLALLLAVAAVFLWRNYAASPAVEVSTVQAAAPAPQSTRITAPTTRAVAAPPPRQVSQPAPAAPVSSTIIVAPGPKGGLGDRFKTGPNPQNTWTATSGQLKTGPNAQNNWTPTSGQLKTGPKAQTDLTMKRSWK